MTAHPSRAEEDREALLARVDQLSAVVAVMARAARASRTNHGPNAKAIFPPSNAASRSAAFASNSFSWGSRSLSMLAP
jgi:hypothetical protein